MLKPVSFSINAYLIRAVGIENHQLWGGPLWKAFKSEQTSMARFGRLSRPSQLFSPWLLWERKKSCCRRGRRMGLRKCSCDGLLQMHVLWVDYILSIPAYQARDTGRRLVSEPLPEVTSCRPSGAWLRIAFCTFTVHGSGAITIP
jgi:hypothetical protein